MTVQNVSTTLRITDAETVYPGRYWNCFVESDRNRNTAEVAAMNALVLTNCASYSAHCRALIAENEKFIQEIRRRAEEALPTFGICMRLAFAKSAAELAYNFCAVSSILQPENAGQSAAYRSVAELVLFKHEMLRYMAVGIHVNGDVSGQMPTVFVVVFTSRGFRTRRRGL